MQIPAKHPVVHLIDIDGTLIWRDPTVKMIDAVPLQDAVETVNKWFEEGAYIIFWTARTPAYEDRTRKQLDEIGVKYHELRLDKPYAELVHIWDDAKFQFHPVERNVGLGAAVAKEEHYDG